MESIAIYPIQVIAGLAAFISAAICVSVVKSLLVSRRLFDMPNERSSHSTPTPRGGGVGIVAGVALGIAIAVLLGLPAPSWSLLVGGAIVAAIGIHEDWVGELPVVVRLAGQCIAAIVVVSHAGALDRVPLPAPGDFSLGWWGYLVAIVWIVGVTNIYNFLDGIDGYAAFQGLVAAIALWLAAPNGAVAVVAVPIACACAGFLLYNWHPARIFMGDSGSLLMGFLFASLPFEFDAASRGSMVLVSALALWFFLADGAFTILRRVLAGEKVWSPHRGHLYQRLLQAGWNHDEIVLTVHVAAAPLAVAAGLLGVRLSGVGGWALLAAAGLMFFAYCLRVFWCERSFHRNIDSSASGSAGATHNTIHQ